jgi:hypothetical protein
VGKPEPEVYTKTKKEKGIPNNQINASALYLSYQPSFQETDQLPRS